MSFSSFKSFSFVSMLGFAVATFIAGCDSSSDDNKDKTLSTQKLVMGTSADMPPFESYDGSKVVGFDIDIAKAIAKDLKMTLEIKDMDFSALVPSLQSKRIDVALASMTPSKERLEVIDFSEPYLSLPLAAVTLGDAEINTLSDLSGKTIGVQLGSTHEHFIKERAEDDATIKVHSLNKLGELIQELINGRVDLVLMETKTATAFKTLNQKLRIHEIEGQKVAFAVALPKNSDLTVAINASLEKLREAGTLEELRRKWFSN